MTVDPAEYSVTCYLDDEDRPLTSEELEALRDAFLDDDHEYGKQLDGGWPPTDEAGNVYPIWYTLGDLWRGKLRDSHNYPYDPLSGNLQPVARDEWGCCNAPLDHWRDRYPEIRFCGQVTHVKDDGTLYTYCPTHKGRDNVKTAEEQMQTGMYVKSVDHLFEKIDPWLKVMGWGWFESLMGESKYEFAPEYKPRTFDFSEEPIHPEDADDDGILEVMCGYPTDHPNRALYLYVAAMQSVQMISVQPKIMATETDPETGEVQSRMMESKTIEAAQLTAPPSEHDSTPQEFKTLETWSEHHLNLPLSRIIRDQGDLLEYGGVDADADADDNERDVDDIVLEIDADADGVETSDDTGTDPNQFEEYESQSQRIVDSASSN